MEKYANEKVVLLLCHYGLFPISKLFFHVANCAKSMNTF